MDVIRFIGELYRIEWANNVHGTHANPYSGPRRHTIALTAAVILAVTMFAILSGNDIWSAATAGLIIITTVLYQILRMLTRWSARESETTGIDQNDFGKYSQYKVPYTLIKIILTLVTLLIVALIAMSILYPCNCKA